MENPAFEMQYGLVENLLLQELHMLPRVASHKEVDLLALTKAAMGFQEFFFFFRML